MDHEEEAARRNAGGPLCCARLAQQPLPSVVPEPTLPWPLVGGVVWLVPAVGLLAFGVWVSPPLPVVPTDPGPHGRLRLLFVVPLFGVPAPCAPGVVLGVVPDVVLGVVAGVMPGAALFGAAPVVPDERPPVPPVPATPPAPAAPPAPPPAPPPPAACAMPSPTADPSSVETSAARRRDDRM